MNILMIGDIVGRPGREIIKEKLAFIQKEENITFTIANAENAAGGRGLSQGVKQELLSAGIDVLTMGNHVWDNKEILNFIDDEKRLIRPANFPADCPGQGYSIYTAGFNEKIAVINLCGRIFMQALDCPFQVMDEILADLQGKTDYIVVDFHAEATSEKRALALYLDGKVSVVVGTHTHIQTADETILPAGTGYITDLGMTGAINSILGVNSELIIQKFITQRPVRFEVAGGSAQLNGIVVELDEATHKAKKIKRISERNYKD
jgi:metallophosphoesterase (TIGR00282 family)